MTVRIETETILKAISGLTMNIMDNSDFDSAIKVDDANKVITKNLGTMSSTTGMAVSTVKDALNIRVYANELNARIKDGLLANDTATVDYNQNEVNMTLGNIRDTISELPQDESIAKLLKKNIELSELSKKCFRPKAT